MVEKKKLPRKMLELNTSAIFFFDHSVQCVIYPIFIKTNLISGGYNSITELNHNLVEKNVMESIGTYQTNTNLVDKRALKFF